MSTQEGRQGGVEDYAKGYAEGYTDYEGRESGPSFPFFQVSAAGFFYADLKDVNTVGTVAEWIAAAGGTEGTEKKRDVAMIPNLIVNVIANRRRFLIVEPRDGKQLAVRSDYDSAVAEAERRRGKARGHVQTLVLVTGPKGSRAAERPPLLAMITAKGVQSSKLWGIERLIYERCVRPVERGGDKGIPPLAYSVQLGFGPEESVGDFDNTLCPLTIASPRDVLTAEKARSLIRLPVSATRKAYDESRAWLAAWANAGAGDVARNDRRDGGGRDDRRSGGGRDDRQSARENASGTWEDGDDDIPF